MSRAIAFVLLTALALSSCASPKATQVIVIIDAEPGVRATAQRLAISVFGAGSASAVPDELVAMQVLGTASEAVTFPVELALVPRGGDANRRFLVEAAARDTNNVDRGRVRAISSYRRGHVLELRLVLEDDCLDVLACTPDQTCRDASCVSAEVDPETLPDYDPDADGGTDTDGSSGDAAVAAWIQRHYVKPPLQGEWLASVSLDGDRFALGLPNRSFGGVYTSGGVAIYERDGTGAWAFDQIVLAPDPDDGDRCGVQVDLSGDLLAVGCVYDDTTGSGPGTTYTDGGVADSGAVYLFRRDGLGTYQVEAVLKSPHPQARQGTSLSFGLVFAISGDVVAVGAPDDDSGVESNGSNDPWDAGNLANDSGSVFVYRRVGGNWTFDRHLKRHQVLENFSYDGGFGSAVDVQGDRLVVGTSGDSYGGNTIDNTAPFSMDTSAFQSGAVSVYEYAGGVWTMDALIQGTQVNGDHRFGANLALDGSTLVVSAPNDRSTARGVNPTSAPDAAATSGAVYVFARDGAGTWSQTAWIKPPGELSDDSNHMRVAVFGDRLVLGMRYEDASVRGVGAISDATEAVDTDQGAAFVYRRDAGAWSFDAYLKAHNADPGDEFGGAVAIGDRCLVVLAEGEDGGGTDVDDPGTAPDFTDSGAAYVFTRP